MKITEVKVKCPLCGWKGTVFDAESDEEGSPICPNCLCSLMCKGVKP